jgi:hypothetical protein
MGGRRGQLGGAKAWGWSGKLLGKWGWGGEFENGEAGCGRLGVCERTYANSFEGWKAACLAGPTISP